MNHQLLIHNYIDGTLDSVQEDILFSQMAENQALRTELGEQMRLHRIAKSDMAATIVPPDITASVFEGLGFVLQSDAVSGAVATTVKTPKLMMWLGILGAALLSSVLTIFFMKSMGDTAPASKNVTTLESNEQKQDVHFSAPSLHTETSAASQSESSSLSPSLSATSPSSHISTHSAELQHYNNNSSAETTTQHSREIRMREQADNRTSKQADKQISNGTDAIETSSSEETTAMMQDISDAPLLKNLAGTTSSLSVREHPLPFAMPDFLAPMPLNESHNLSLQLRGMSFAMFTPDISAPVSTKPDINNISAGVFYRVADDHELGIEVGRESYSQEFIKAFGTQTLIYHQSPALYFCGITYRYSPSFLRIGNDWMGVYMQGAAAWAQNGPIVRVGTGICLLPESRISLNGGVDYSYLYYPVQANYFSSSKIVLTFGAAIRW